MHGRTMQNGSIVGWHASFAGRSFVASKVVTAWSPRFARCATGMGMRVIWQRFGSVRPATRCSGFDKRRGSLGPEIVLESLSIWMRGETEEG